MPNFFIAAIPRLPFLNPADFHASSPITVFSGIEGGRIGH